ncbi:MAG: dTDP-4-amino-4,6-dideoxygalactose transaminase [Alphaproteobacteria bacterium]|nr:dTDP-4-amino-4,6-dideoxygalactose transaminase [Alphaproteobacteria bacterium]
MKNASLLTKLKDQEEFTPFVKPYISKKTLDYLKESLDTHHLHGDGYFTRKCHDFIENLTRTHKALLTHSCTGALEMAILLIDLKEGDEVIMPSYTFSSTANAVALRGGVPCFIDIREDTLNMDEDLIEKALTPKTKAILAVHYAGVSANMEKINQIASKNNLFVIEDAAQGVGCSFQNKSLGTLGHLGAYSFHATKNIISGEGGALLINDPRFVERAEVIREKGTNRSQFIRGEVDKYTWQDIGSSYLPSDLTAALLLSQLEEIEHINKERILIWDRYHEAFKWLEEANLARRPFVPIDCIHNAHIYYLIVRTSEIRNDFLQFAKSCGIQCTSHYVPLHSSPAGLKFGRVGSHMKVTDEVADQILRLPLGSHLTQKDVDNVIETVNSYFRTI